MVDNTQALNNPYQTLVSNLIDERTESGLLPLFVVANKKLAVMFIVTMGMYGVFWFYQNFKIIKRSKNDSSWPAMRASFAVFFTHSLFKTVHEQAEDQGVHAKWSHASLATAFVVLTLVSSFSGYLTPLASLSTFIVTPLMAHILVQVQTSVNFMHQDPVGIANDRFTAANILWMALGLLLWVSVLLDITSVFGIN